MDDQNNGIGLNDEIYKCAYCGTEIPWDDVDEKRGAIFVCENDDCGKHFCATCFTAMTDKDVGETCDSTSLLCPDCLEREKRIAHLIVYHDPTENYVGIDAFVDFETALKQFKRTLNDTIEYNGGDPGWINELVLKEDTFSLYFRDKSRYECFYRREVIQETMSEESENREL